MYAELRQRPSLSSKAAGVSAAAGVTLLVAYALMSGLAQQIVTTILPPMTVSLVDRTPPPPPPPPDQTLQTQVDLPDAPPPPLAPPETFQADDSAARVVIGGPRSDGEGDHATGLTKGAGTGGGPARVLPKLISADLPDYPPASKRAHETGTTSLEVCLNEKGRVTSASVATSSGFARLDEATLLWVKRARFRPASVGGVPQTMCGHRIDYEWNLEKLCVNEDARGKEDKLKPCPSKAG